MGENGILWDIRPNELFQLQMSCVDKPHDGCPIWSIIAEFGEARVAYVRISRMLEAIWKNESGVLNRRKMGKQRKV